LVIDIEYVGVLHGQECVTYEDEEEFKQALLSMSNQERITATIPKATLSDARKKTTNGQTFRLNNKTIKKLRVFIKQKKQSKT